VIGLVLALVVVAIVVSLVGLIWIGIPIGVVAIILFVVFVLGFGRRSTSRRARGP
jgi:hypothetical protein